MMMQTTYHLARAVHKETECSKYLIEAIEMHAYTNCVESDKMMTQINGKGHQAMLTKGVTQVITGSNKKWDRK
jgi:hypothetical protein